MTRSQAKKKVEIAIDKMVGLQDGGWGDPDITRVLELLNNLSSKLSRS